MDGRIVPFAPPPKEQDPPCSPPSTLGEGKRGALPNAPSLWTLRAWLTMRVMLLSLVPLCAVIIAFFITFSLVNQYVRRESRSVMESDALQFLHLATTTRSREFEKSLLTVQRMNQEVANAVMEALGRLLTIKHCGWKSP